MRPDIKFASPLREAQKDSAPLVFTFCSRLATFVHDKKIFQKSSAVALVFAQRRQIPIHPIPPITPISPIRTCQLTSKKNCRITEPGEPGPKRQQLPTEPQVSRSEPQASPTEPGSLQLSLIQTLPKINFDLREPENSGAFPENERLMPENEPENILKIQLRWGSNALSPLILFRSADPSLHTIPDSIQRCQRYP